MSQIQPTRSVSPLKKLVTFTSQTAGLEKTLRLIQAVSWVVAEVTDDKTLATQCVTARNQLALTRRYFRLLDFYGCFERVLDLLTQPASTGTFLSVLELAQYTFLGLYLLLEDLTILHDMGVAKVDWYRPVLTEANKFWFYAIALSIVRALWGLLFTSSASSTPASSKTGGKKAADEKEKKKKKQNPSAPSKWPFLKRLVIDVCDLTLPGSFIGWVPATGLQIGGGMVVSTVLAGQGVWAGMGL
ncbi:peroxisomal biogenesis factor 11 [Aspergillus egyptiacus]|nr:peroxisomal biogenesis factor 11 [Aspergillus egyptiacus]